WLFTDRPGFVGRGYRHWLARYRPRSRACQQLHGQLPSAESLGKHQLRPRAEGKRANFQRVAEPNIALILHRFLTRKGKLYILGLPMSFRAIRRFARRAAICGGREMP